MACRKRGHLGLEPVNSMIARDEPIPIKTKGTSQENKPKRDKDTAYDEEKERTYDIDRLNLGDPTVESVNDSK